MNNILPCTPESVNNFLDAAAKPTKTSNLYARISRNDFLELNNKEFLVYSLFRSLANFKDQSVHLVKQGRWIRSQYHKRTIRRHVGSLANKGRLERLGKSEWGMVRDRRGRPVRLQFINMVTDERTALIARFIMLLAYYRGSWSELTTRRIRALLGIRTQRAAELFRWLQSRRNSLHRRTLRAIVFFSQEPDWWNWKTGGSRSTPDKKYSRFPIVRAAHSPINKVVKRSNQYPEHSPGKSGIPTSPLPKKAIDAILNFVSGSNHVADRFDRRKSNLENVRSVVAAKPKTIATRKPNLNTHLLRSGYDPPGKTKPTSPGIPSQYEGIREALRKSTWGYIYFYWKIFIVPISMGGFSKRQVPIDTLSVLTS